VWDSSLPPGVTRRWPVELERLGGEAAEPILVELRYVYTGDEVPRDHRDPGEPTSVVFAEATYEAGALPACPPTAGD
jgi:hypothetical protein